MKIEILRLKGRFRSAQTLLATRRGSSIQRTGEKTLVWCFRPARGETTGFSKPTHRFHQTSRSNYTCFLLSAQSAGKPIAPTRSLQQNFGSMSRVFGRQTHFLGVQRLFDLLSGRIHGHEHGMSARSASLVLQNNKAGQAIGDVVQQGVRINAIMPF